MKRRIFISSILLFTLSSTLTVLKGGISTNIKGRLNNIEVISALENIDDYFSDQDIPRKKRSQSTTGEGSSGSTGTQGTGGNSGTTGTQGGSGTTGSSGSTGTQGTGSNSGTTGTQSGSGTTGSSGSTGTQGTGSNSGTTGTQGGSGTTGSSGSTGTQGTGSNSGTTGTQGGSGTTGSSGSTGTQGTGSNSGTTGTQGGSGTTGSSGSTGTQGTGSNSGTTGTQGGSGTTGSSGSTGTQGTGSNSGTTGTQGGSGTTGSSGSTGTQGTGSNSGTTGTQSGTEGTEYRNFELLVEPYRKLIYNGEQTTISIDLHEFDSIGLMIQGFRQEVMLEVTGLVDGTITHKSGKIALDDAGIAWIDYKAGQKDKQIRISATFTPPGYPEEVKGDATIIVKPLDYEATLTLRGRFSNTQNSSFTNKHSDGIEKGNFSLNERSEASFYVPLKLENSGDMPMFNQRWEYYRPLDINLSSFNALYRLKDYDYASHGNFGFEKTRTINKNPVNRKIPEKDYLLQSNIILIIDKETSKVVKIVTGGFPVEFQWDEIEKTTGRSWNPDGSEPIENFSHKTDEMSTQFTPGPVEDLIPDPTMKSVSESLRTYLKNLGTPLPADVEIPEDTEDKAEIPPDLLVEFGDGKTYFGGDGKKVIDKSKGSNIDRKEYTFFWQVTRKKKPL